MAGTLTIQGLSAGLISGQNNIGPVTMTGTVAEGQRTEIVFSGGDNTLAVPSGATAVLIVIGTNSAALKIRTNLNSGDGGTPFGPAGFCVLPLYTGTTSVIVNAASGSGTAEAVFI